MEFIYSLRQTRLWLAASFVLLLAVYYPVLSFMGLQWYADPNYSHGFIVPLISGYFLWQRVEDLKKAQAAPSNYGLAVIMLGLVMLILAFAGTEYFVMRLSFIVVLAGMVLYFFGKEVFRVLRLPLGYLFFMVPLPYIVYDAVAFPLKLFVARYSVLVMKAMGIIVWREGNIMMLPNIELEVADACSGIRSLLSLIALAVALAYFSQNSNIKRVIVVLLAVPVAIFANGVRVVTTGVLAQYWGAAAAEGFFHEFAGFAVFILAISMLLGLGAVVRRIGR